MTQAPSMPPPPSPSNATAGVPQCRGVRGATTIDADERDQVLRSTRQLLALMIRRNDIASTDLASATFTVTKDIESEFPALAARQLGWEHVPLLCGYEISIRRSLPRCIRVLLHWNTTKTQSEIQHVYMHEARRLRPDLCDVPPVDFDELERWIEANLREEDPPSITRPGDDVPQPRLRLVRTRWIASTSLSVVRGIVATGTPPGSGPAGGEPIKLPGVDASTTAALHQRGLQLDRRLVDASVRTHRFYTELIDDLTAADVDAMPSAAAIESVLLRCGVSVLAIDPLAASVHRDLDAAANSLTAAVPRLSEQLRLRMGPLRSGFDSYGPGVLRSVGRTIWNGPEPADWWPKTVTVHGVMPWRGGASDAHPADPSVWIEAMLTDRDPRVPEWMRLAFQVLRVAAGRHTGTGSQAGDPAAAQTLPWSVGMIPVLIDAASAAGAIPPLQEDDFASAVATALQLWRRPAAGEQLGDQTLANRLAQWWWSIREVPSPFPKKLQALRLLT